MAEIIPIGLHKKYYEVVGDSNIIIATPLIDLLHTYAVRNYAVEGNDLLIILENNQLELVQSYASEGAAVQGMINEYVCDLYMLSKGVKFFPTMELAVEHVMAQRESKKQ